MCLGMMMKNPLRNHLFEVLHYLSQEDESVEAYIDEDGELVFEIDYEEYMKMLKRIKEEEDGELS